MSRQSVPHLVSCGFVAFIAMAAGPRAQASGCHVDERPQLGGFVALDPYLLTVDLLLGESIHPGNWIPRSCPGETPQAPTARIVIGEPVVGQILHHDRNVPSGWLADESPLLRPMVATFPSDPPPRASRSVAAF